MSLNQKQNVEKPIVEIQDNFYDTLKQISEITGITMKKMVNNEIKELLDQIAHDPAIFLDHFIGIENMKDPIKTIKQLKVIVDIPEYIIENLEEKGVIDFIKAIKSNRPRKSKKTIEIEIELPEEYNKFFEYLELNLNLKRQKYLTDIIKKEINSRNKDLNIF